MGKMKNKVGKVLTGERFSAGSMTALVLAAVITLNVLLYIIVRMFGLYLYSTEDDDISISGSTDVLFEEAIENAKIDGKKVKISFCLVEDEARSHDTGSFVYKTAKYFEERYPDLIELDFINILTMRNKNGELVDDLDKFKTDMNGNETPVTKASVIFEYGKNYRVLTDTYTPAGFANFYTLDSEGSIAAYNGEEVMAGMISWVLAEEHKTAYFTQFHGETVDLSFSNLLASAGYYVDVVDLRKDEIPENADLLVISNPTSDLERSAENSTVRSELDRLSAYMERGGNLFVALDPYAKSLPVLEGFLSEWGISVRTSTAESGDVRRHIIKDRNNAITTDGFTLVTDFATGSIAQKIKDNVSVYNSDGNVIVSSAAVLDVTGDAFPLLISSSSAVAEVSGSTVSKEGSYAVAAASQRTYGENTSRVFVVSSIYLAVSDTLVTTGYSNRDFVYSLLECFFGAGRMPSGSKVVTLDTQTLRNLKLGTARLYATLIFAVPTALTITGAVIVIKRKNR